MRYCKTRRGTNRMHPLGVSAPVRRNRSCQGQTLVETCLVLMTFFILSFALIDFSWLMFSQMNMQDAVREAGRYASTGRHASDPKNPGSNLSRIDSIEQVMYYYGFNSSANCPAGNLSISNSGGTTGAAAAGAPYTTVTITANCAIPMLTNSLGKWFGNDNKYHFTVSTTFQNEPFPTNQTN